MSVTSIEVYAERVLQAVFASPVKNDSELTNPANWPIVGETSSLTVNEVVAGGARTVTSVFLIVSPLVAGELYTASPSVAITDPNNNPIAANTVTFKGRKTKTDLVIARQPPIYDQRLTSKIRHLLTAVARSDDRIGGSQSETIKIGLQPVVFPESLPRWIVSYPDVTAPDHIWTFQETGEPVEDQVGDKNLSDMGSSPTYGAAGELGRTSVETSGGGAEGVESSDANFLDVPDGTSISIWMRVFVPSGATADPVFGKRINTSPQFGWHCEVNETGDFRVECRGAVNSAGVSAQGTAVTDDSWHNVIVVFDGPNDEIRITSDAGTGSVDFSAVGALDTTDLFACGPTFFTAPAAGTRWGYGAAWVGTALLQAEMDILAAVSP